MSSQTSFSTGSMSKHYVAALVLGTALSTIASLPVRAGGACSAGRAVNDLSRYCVSCWRNARVNPDLWSDCTQEVFCRLLQRDVGPDRWECLLRDEGDDKRELIRAIDTVKKRALRARRFVPLPEDQLLHTADTPDGAMQREEFLRVAADRLTPRQNSIVRMSLEGWSVQEIASRLALRPERVSDEKYKAIHKLRDGLEDAQA